MIIGLVNQKGGVGKTTIAVNLSAGISGEQHPVLLLDTDPQGSVLQWYSIEGNPSFDVRHHPEPVNRSLFRSLGRNYAHVMIDSPPGMGAITRSILGICHLAIIPIGPSPLDIWSSKETVELLLDSKRKNRSLEGRLLICRKIPRTRIGREAKEAMEIYDLPVFKTEICQRVAYVQAMLSGVPVLTYAPASEAASEINRLCEEVTSTMEE
jgi:chromosome partitioning protein